MLDLFRSNAKNLMTPDGYFNFCVPLSMLLDFCKYYKRAVTLVDAEQLGGTVMEQLAELFEADGEVLPGRRRR